MHESFHVYETAVAAIYGSYVLFKTRVGVFYRI